jgi:2-amino-4-hydroxy-6-hydroxymethyldihydropteridine diphosphokinase
MTDVYIGIGTNIEPRFERMEQAVNELRSLSSVMVVSSIYETSPVGVTEQSHFLNAVVMLQTVLEPDELLEELRDMELSLGRQHRERWHQREIDFDILFFGNEIVNHDGLQIPHPRLQERKFVLEPLTEIAPTLVHPVLGKTIEELNNGLHDPTQQIVRI